MQLRRWFFFFYLFFIYFYLVCLSCAVETMVLFCLLVFYLFCLSCAGERMFVVFDLLIYSLYPFICLLIYSAGEERLNNFFDKSLHPYNRLYMNR